MSDAGERANCKHYDLPVLEHRVHSLEGAVHDISEAIKTIAASMSQIARLELMHAETRNALERAFSAIEHGKVDLERVDERVKAIETAIPTLKESSNWIRAGMVVLSGAVIMAAISGSFKF